uniref:gamma-glutamyl-gamma-aminobutyrate hydrolase family protein n=1 Tax=Rhodococcus qingshengii TaxID=334542 RepID=UPI001C4DF6F3|nr:gamma-glutamyl-gamma-aminobutyrate hydrolase family protein [Rhodococcus qingshengii]
MTATVPTGLAMKPLIGITGRRLPSASLATLEPRYQKTSIDMFFSDFPKWVAAAGGLPVEIPYEGADPDLMQHLHGVIITGGQDVDPSRYNGDPSSVKGPTDTDRDHYEVTLATAALESDVPILGVCRGAQIINVALGGTLVPDLTPMPIDHVSIGLPVETMQHTVDFTPGSLAHDLYGDRAMVNSLHHQAVDQPGRDVQVTGRADDGTVESFEIAGRRALAVQWHPEWVEYLDPAFEWIVRAAASRAIHAH